MSTVGFKVYIDESGDEGFCFNEDAPGSSRWFVISAVVTRASHDLEAVKLVDNVRSVLRCRQRKDLHFRRLKHEQRIPYVEQIARARLRTVTVCVHKPSIHDPEKFADKFLLYHYATRFLLERVSWLCRDKRYTQEDIAEVIFSNRSHMSYEALRDYLLLLRQRTSRSDIRIDWSAISPDRILARPHNAMMGLQIADAVASAMWYGVEPSRYGFTEPTYAQRLCPVVYSHRSRQLGHGFKLWPREAEGLIDTDPKLFWIRSTYQ
jgi:hypothetical protein